MTPLNNQHDLNAGQQAAKDSFLEFLMAPDETYMIIQGPGGCGKTYLLGNLINSAIPAYETSCTILGMRPEYTSVSMTATTNKAAEVLGKEVGIPTETIFTALGLTVKTDFATGKTSIVSARNKQDSFVSNTILFIDEASMVDGELENFIKYKTHNCKIVFIGDPCQLAPVGYKVSPIFTRGYRTALLSEPMRNNGQPALMALCDQCRKTVETEEFLPIDLVEGVIDYMDGEDLQAYIDGSFLVLDSPDRILGFTNNKVNQYNEYIREIRGLPQEFSQGEYLISCSVLQLGSGSKIRVEDELLVESISELRTHTIHGMDIDYYSVAVSGKFVFNEEVKIPADMNHYQNVRKYLAKHKEWVSYFKLDSMFLSVRARECMTIYKAQGSTVDTVIIDLGDVSVCKVPAQAARLIYVAVSRARNRIILTGTLASRLGGINYGSPLRKKG